MPRQTGRHPASPEFEAPLPPIEEDVYPPLDGVGLPDSDPEETLAFEAEFFGAPEEAAPQAEMLLVQSARYRVIHGNPEDRPFARGVVLDKIEQGDKDAYLSGRTSRSRQRRRRVMVVLASVLALALAAAGIYHLKTGELRYAQTEERFHQAVAMMQETDEVVVGIDTAVNSQVTADGLTRLQDLLDRVPQTEDELQQVIGILDEIEPAMKRHNNGDIVAQLRTSAEARLAMLEAGSELVGYDIEAMRSSESFAEGWMLITTADKLSREAGAFATYATSNNVSQALNLNNQALADLTDAKARITEASQAFPDADFSTLQSYIDSKMKALGYASAADQAFLDGDTATVDAQTALYTAEDANAVAFAQKLPTDPSQIILGAYDKVTAAPRKSYVEARQQAADAEAAVRNYLGINEVITDRTATDELVTEVSGDTAAGETAAETDGTSAAAA